MKQVKTENETEKGELSFVSKQQPLSRVTNAVIKSILKNKSSVAETSSKPKSAQAFPNVERQIKKKAKKNLKKEIWNKSKSIFRGPYLLLIDIVNYKKQLK